MCSTFEANIHQDFMCVSIDLNLTKMIGDFFRLICKLVGENKEDTN